MPLDPAEVWKTASKLLDNKPKQDSNISIELEKYKSMFQKINTQHKTPLIRNYCKSFDYKIHKNYFPEFIFKKMSDTTLFFIFYDNEFSSEKNPEFVINLKRNRFYSLQTLKSRGWRFHNFHKTFFYRLHKPKIFAKDHEVGDYAFYNPVSCSIEGIFDFVFEFQYLEMY